MGASPSIRHGKGEPDTSSVWTKKRTFSSPIFAAHFYCPAYVKKYLFILFNLFLLTLRAQSYPPGAGVPGSTAIYKDSSAFVNWASACHVARGLQDVSTPSVGFASAGDSTMACGKADGITVSLGDGGVAICTFPNPISDGPGFDFAVFENSFDGNFLELAFVEVSSDGNNFARFKSHSLTDTTIQTASFGNTDPTKINNLAGKYAMNYGTPFDLQELATNTLVSINKITHVRITDVVGSMQKQFATRDGFGNKVNDPWTTPFPSSGFDLDAVGVIHELKITGEKEFQKKNISIFPNPVNSEKIVFISDETNFEKAELQDLNGNVLKTSFDKKINLTGFPGGVYVVKIYSGEEIFYNKIILVD